MKALKFSSLILILILVNCAKKDPDLRPSEELTIYVYTERINSTHGYCYVDFRDPQDNHNIYHLEPEDMVICGGTAASRFNGGWTAHFYHPGTEPARVDIIRPSAGSAVVRYSELK